MLLLAAALALQVQVRDDVKDWKLLKSDHFDLYYPSDDLEPRAREFLGFFEDARARIASTCGATLERRINVFLYRSYHDLSQSAFLARSRVMPDLRAPLLKTAAPRPCCHVARSRAFALAEPLRDRIFIHCQAIDRWNQWFVRHELVHQLQFQEIYPWRLPSFLLALKDPLIPQWFWEGFADYGAAIFDSAKDEWLRSGGIFGLKEMFSGDALNDHDYLAVYYQASMFFKFLDEEIGPGTAAALFRTYAKTFPLTMNRVLRSSTGRDRGELETAFRDWLTRRTAAADSRPGPDGRLSDDVEHYRRRAWGARRSPDGRRIAVVSDKNVRTELFVDGVGQAGWRRAWDLHGIHSPPSWAADSRRLVVAGWWQNHDYLLICEDGLSESIRLDFDEVTDPAWSPGGDVIVFVGLKHGTADLYLLSLRDRSVRRLTEDTDAESAPAWSPDGKKLAFLHEVGGRTVLTILDVDSGKRETPAPTHALLERPQWSAAGIVLSADVEGIYDAFLVDPATGAASRLTRYRGGVHFPQLTADGRRLLFSYTAERGSAIHEVDVAPQEEKAFAQEDRRDAYDLFRKPAPQGVPAEKSRRFAVDYFVAPLSSQSFVTPGLDFQLGDLEGENVLSLTVAGLSERGWIGSAVFRNARWRPTFGMGVTGEATGRLRRVSGGPFVEIPGNVVLQAGWLARETHEFEEDFNDPHAFDSGPVAGVFYSSQAGVQPRDPSWGLSLGGSAAWFREDLGGDRDLHEYLGVVETQLALAQDWILWTRASYEKKLGPLLDSEALDIASAVRGATSLEGTDLGRWTVELRFPIWRELFIMPLELIGLGEYLLLKDLRGFVFGDAGFAGLSARDLDERDRGAVSAGAGLRLDLFFMAWPFLNVRAPVRLEFWVARVGMSGRGPEDEAGFGLVLGY